MIRNPFCVGPKADRSKQINDSVTIEVFPIEHLETVKIMLQRRVLTSGRKRKGPEMHRGCTMKRVIDTYIQTCFLFSLVYKIKKILRSSWESSPRLVASKKSELH